MTSPVTMPVEREKVLIATAVVYRRRGIAFSRDQGSELRVSDRALQVGVPRYPSTHQPVPDGIHKAQPILLE